MEVSGAAGSLKRGLLVTMGETAGVDDADVEELALFRKSLPMKLLFSGSLPWVSTLESAGCGDAGGSCDGVAGAGAGGWR
jgi:hypothetical protein